MKQMLRIHDVNRVLFPLMDFFPPTYLSPIVRSYLKPLAMSDSRGAPGPSNMPEWGILHVATITIKVYGPKVNTNIIITTSGFGNTWFGLLLLLLSYIEPGNNRDEWIRRYPTKNAKFFLIDKKGTHIDISFRRILSIAGSIVKKKRSLAVADDQHHRCCCYHHSPEPCLSYSHMFVFHFVWDSLSPPLPV